MNALIENDNYIVAEVTNNSPLLRLATQIVKRNAKTTTAVFSKVTAVAARISTTEVN